MTASNSRLEGYDFHRPLGAGGMGQVWLGSKKPVDGIRKHVAIKLVPSVAASGRARKRFLDEARVSALLRHSNIVQVLDVGVEGDVGFIVMEWIDGVDLNQAMTQGPWPPHVIGFVIGELLQALDHAQNLQHERRPLELIHRDISPHNVLVSRHGEVKLADFGIARSRVAKATDMGIGGKWRYMAPEQLRGDPSRRPRGPRPSHGRNPVRARPRRALARDIPRRDRKHLPHGLRPAADRRRHETGDVRWSVGAR